MISGVVLRVLLKEVAWADLVLRCDRRIFGICCLLFPAQPNQSPKPTSA